MSEIWFLLFIILLVIEIFTVDLVSIWFATAALICGFIAIFIDNILIELILFIVMSVILLILTRPFMKKMKVNKAKPLNLDRVIGREAIVTKTIAKNNTGEVKVLSKIWTAISDESIKEGSIVIVEKIEGVKLVVKKRGEK